MPCTDRTEKKAIAEEEKNKLESTLEETTTHLRNISDKSTRDAETQIWKELKQDAESQAKTISENQREQRNKKLTQKERGNNPYRI